MMKRSAKKLSTKNQKERKTTQEPVLFDLKESTIQLLGIQIAHCVRKSIDLICFSSFSMRYPEKSLTNIPGLSLLFIKACLQHGLLGYLDWKHETSPSKQNSIIINNVIIATCGLPASVELEPASDLIEDNMPREMVIAHDVDPIKLKYIREKSRAKFEELLILH